MLQRTRVAIGLGSNKGDRLAFLRKAALRLREDVLQNAQASSIYETPAWGGVTDKPFLNAVLVGDTDWKPAALVNYLKETERDLGRTQTERNGDREIDLDLLAHGDTVWSGEGVEVPHPGLPERDFVLVPFCEVWPQWKHPRHGLSARSLLDQVLHSQGSRVQKLATAWSGDSGVS